jgi:hypothetical protein
MQDADFVGCDFNSDMATCAGYNIGRGAVSPATHLLLLGGVMPQSRRDLLTIFIGAAGAFAAQPVLLAGVAMQRSPQPIPSPNAPNPNFPPGLDGPDMKRPSDKKEVDPRKQEEIRSDIQKLFELASELKEESQKTDLNSTMPVTVIKKAQQIEKLAKQIKELSKG